MNQRNKTIYKERHKINNTISYLRNKKNKTEKDIERLNILLEQRNEMNKKRRANNYVRKHINRIFWFNRRLERYL